MTLYKKFRIENELSQKEMAKKLNISINAYRNYELGIRTMPSEILIKFLELRNCGDDYKLVEVLKEIYQYE